LRQSCLCVEKRIGAEGTFKYIKLAKKEVCGGLPHLEKFLQDLLDQGGEGIILRDPHAPYRPGRNTGYLKHKVHE